MVSATVEYNHWWNIMSLYSWSISLFFCYFLLCNAWWDIIKQFVILSSRFLYQSSDIWAYIEVITMEQILSKHISLKFYTYSINSKCNNSVTKKQKSLKHLLLIKHLFIYKIKIINAHRVLQQNCCFINANYSFHLLSQSKRIGINI